MIAQEQSFVLAKEEKHLLEETSSDSAETLELVSAVKEALAGIEQGEFVAFEEIKREFSSWFTE